MAHAHDLKSPFALWWVSRITEPTVAEVAARLEHLRKHVVPPPQKRFALAQAFAAPGMRQAQWPERRSHSGHGCLA